MTLRTRGASLLAVLVGLCLAAAAGVLFWLAPWQSAEPKGQLQITVLDPIAATPVKMAAATGIPAGFTNTLSDRFQVDAFSRAPGSVT